MDPLRLIMTQRFVLMLMLIVGKSVGTLSIKEFNDNEADLQERLFNGYHSDVHPFGEKRGRSVKVVFDTQIIRIIKVSEREQFIQVYLWINQYWRNELLQWNPDQYQGLEQIHVSPKKVWVPDIVLYNNVDDDGRLAGGLETFKAKVRLTYDGNNTWLNPVMYKCICRLDVSFFPFDDQECFLKFGSWAFDASAIDMEAKTEEATSNTYYVPNGEWKLLSIRAKRNEKFYQCCPIPYVDVTVTIKLRREALSYTLNLVIPCALLSSLIVLGFILPPESGERIGLSITVLLSVTVFQQLTSQLMPPYDFPYLAQYYLATICETGLSLVVTTIILNFYHRSNRRMPKILKKLLLDWLGPILFCGSFDPSGGAEIDGKKDIYDASDTDHDNEDGSVRASWTDVPTINEAIIDEGNNGIRDGKFRLMRHKTRNTINVTMQKNNSFHSAIVDTLAHAPMPIFDEKTQRIRQRLLELESKKAAQQQKQEWMYAARVLDRFFLVFFVVMSTVVILVIFLRAPRFKLI